jgi:hypothetical protein
MLHFLTRSPALGARHEDLRRVGLLVLGGVSEAKVAIAEGGSTVLARHGLAWLRDLLGTQSANLERGWVHGVVLRAEFAIFLLTKSSEAAAKELFAKTRRETIIKVN